MIKKETKIYDRRIIIIDNEEKKSYYNSTNLSIALTGISTAATRSTLGVLGTALIPGVMLVTSALGLKKMYDISKENKKKSNIGFGEIDYCFDNFRFPPQHPQRGIVYSCPDYESDYYIPISNFHEYSLKLKESAFNEMCAHLGAKEIILTEEIIDDKKTNINVEANGVPTQVGEIDAKLDVNHNKKTTTGTKKRILLSKPKKFNNTKYESKWIDSEPTWRSLQKMRLDNKLNRYTVEFNYADEMGINSNLSIGLRDKGLKIGGEFKKMKNVKREYDIIFWAE
jgi:hypothetical protein